MTIYHGRMNNGDIYFGWAAWSQYMDNATVVTVWYWWTKVIFEDPYTVRSPVNWEYTQ